MIVTKQATGRSKLQAEAKRETANAMGEEMWLKEWKTRS
jgi:hypothetical protein